MFNNNKLILSHFYQALQDDVQQLQKDLEKTEIGVGVLPCDSLENILKSLNVSMMSKFFY